jgi:hypothetical protein
MHYGKIREFIKLARATVGGPTVENRAFYLAAKSLERDLDDEEIREYFSEEITTEYPRGT